MEEDVLERNDDELKRILTFIRQMEGIIRNSSNAGQVERIRKELIKYRARLNQMAPESNAQSATVDEIAHSLGIENSGEMRSAKTTSTSNVSKNVREEEDLMLVNSLNINKASPHCSDFDINFLSTVLLLIQKEYWPVISEQHCKVDFSHGTVRDTIRNKMDNAMRNLKVLAETIEEYATADKQDFREQLLKMKNKQSRIFLIETNTVLKEISAFVEELANDVNTSGSIVVNKSDIIEFNPRFEEAEKLNGKTVSYAVTEFNVFVKQVLKKINLPEFRQGK